MKIITNSNLILAITLWFSVSIAEASADKYKDQSIFKILQVSKVIPLKLSVKIEDQISKSKDDHAIVFFASWCGICHEEIMAFLQKVKSGKCSRISFISVDEDKTALDKYLQKIPKIDANIYWDQNLGFSKVFNVEKLPAVVYLDRNKNVKRVQSGGRKALNLIEIMIANADGRQGHCE